MALITKPDRVTVRNNSGAVSDIMLADIVFQGGEVTFQEVESRLEAAVNAMVSPYVVSVHIHQITGILSYAILQGPPGSIPPPNWWEMFDEM